MTADISAAPTGSPFPSPGCSGVPPSRPRSALRGICWVLVVIGYLLVGYAWLGPGDLDRSDRDYLFFWYVAFLARTFQFHTGVVFAMLAAGCLIARWNRPALAAVPILLMTLGPSVPCYMPRSMRSPTVDTQRVMSANLLYLNDVHQPIIDEILKIEPDVLLLQEYTDRWHQTIQPAISKVYPHAVWVTRPDAFGVAIYAKRPMEPDPRRQLDCGDVSLPLCARSLRSTGGALLCIASTWFLRPGGVCLWCDGSFGHFANALAAKCNRWCLRAISISPQSPTCTAPSGR